MIQLTLTLKMTTAQVVETSVTVNNNSPIQNYVHPDDQTQPFFLIRSQVFSCSVWSAWLSISQPFTCHAFSNSNRITWGMFLLERLQFLHTVMVKKTHKIKFNTVHVLSDSPGWSHWSLGCESGACRSVSIPHFSIIRFCNTPFFTEGLKSFIHFLKFLHCQSNHAATPLSLCGVCLPIIFLLLPTDLHINLG